MENTKAGKGVLPFSRRQFLRSASLTAVATVSNEVQPFLAWTQTGTSAPPIAARNIESPDYSIEIAKVEWELASKEKIRTTACSG